MKLRDESRNSEAIIVRDDKNGNRINIFVFTYGNQEDKKLYLFPSLLPLSTQGTSQFKISKYLHDLQIR